MYLRLMPYSSTNSRAAAPDKIVPGHRAAIGALDLHANPHLLEAHPVQRSASSPPMNESFSSHPFSLLLPGTPRSDSNSKTVSHPTHTIVDVAFSIDAIGFDNDGM